MRNSPFAIFRRNQRQLMVVLTGLAMFAFIFLDTVSMQSGQLPRMFTVLLVAMICAGGLWVVGAPRGKGNEWAMYGALLGAVVAFFGLRAQSNGVIVQTSIGNFTREDFRQIGQRRALANRFVFSAAKGQMQGFGNLDDQSLLQRAILLHEAEARGISVSDDGVTDFIKRITDDKLSLPDYKNILRELGLPETELFDILREELSAQLALQMNLPPAQQSGMGSLETPLTFWKEFQMLQVRQSLEAAAVPVSPFVAQIPEPKEIELSVFFDRYKNQLPTADGQPGFLQNRKVQLAYLEADFETFEKEVPEPTDSEIAEYYESNKERYRIFDLPDSPLLTPFDDEPASALQPANVSPQGGTAPGPGLPPAPDKPEGAALRSNNAVPIRLVSLQTESDQAPAEQTPAKEAGAAESNPAEKAAETPKSDLELLPTLPGMSSLPPAAGNKPQDAPKYKELDDNLKLEIRDLLLKERAFESMGNAADRALDEMAKLSDRYLAAIEPEAQAQIAREITEAIKEYAASNKLVYKETGLMTQQELMTSTSEPIGSAQEPSANPFQAGTAVWQDAFDNESLYYPNRADSVLRDKRYAYWKIADVPQKVPELKDVRDQVVEAWKLEQARPAAEKRAEQLAAIAREASRPMSESLAGQTVVGTPEGETLTVRETPRFSWLNVPRNLPFQFNPMFSPPPELSPVDGLEGVGQGFMRTVFEDLKPGDVGVAPNQNRSVYYVVRVKERDAAPATGQEENLGLMALRQQFLTTGRSGFAQGPYMYLNRDRLISLLNNWRQTYERSYAVTWSTSENEDATIE